MRLISATREIVDACRVHSFIWLGVRFSKPIAIQFTMDIITSSINWFAQKALRTLVTATAEWLPLLALEVAPDVVLILAVQRVQPPF
jgi:hypothetical protein